MLWTRIHDSRINKSLISQFKRYYHFSSSVHGGGGGVVTTSANCIAAFTKPTTTTTNRFSERSPLYGAAVRFYAAPILPNDRKPDPRDKKGYKMNDKISAEFIRLVVGDDHEVVSRGEALDRARKLNMDLVEVDRLAKPPVCKIMDYNKEKYKKQVKAKEKSKIKAEKSLRSGPMKECRFTKKTEQKDLETKANNVKRVLEKGHRVKCMALGNEDEDLGTMLARLSAMIEDFAVVESGPMVEKRQAYVVVRHKKFGFKKGSSKKSSLASPSTPASINSEQVVGPLETAEELDHTESHSESEDIDQMEESEDIDPDQMDLPHAGGDTIAWSTETEDPDIFGFDEKNKGVVSSSATRQMSGNTDGVFPLEHVPNASLPNFKPEVEAGPRQVDDNRYSGRNEVKSRFQSPSTERPADNRYEVSPRHANQGYRGPSSTNTVPHGPAQVSENRYSGPRRFQPATSIDRTTEKTLPMTQINRGASATNTIPRGPTQAGENRYNGQADVRSRFQRTNPGESPAHSTQFSRGAGATDTVHHGSMPLYHGRQWPKDASGSPSTEHKPLRTDATPVGNFKMSPREQADPNVAGPQRPSYGIFSAPKQARNVATGFDGGRGHSPLDSTGSQNVNGMSRSSEDDQRPELGKTGKWGTFG